MERIKSALAYNLAKARKANDLTQDQAANKIGISRSVLGSYEESRAEPSNLTLLSIFDVYNIPLTDIKRFLTDHRYFPDC